MSEQRIIKAVGGKELRLPELMRDTDDDALNAATEIDQMMAAVRRQLTELTISLRSDLEELRRLVSEAPPIGGAPVLTASSDSASPPSEDKAVPSPGDRARNAADASRDMIDSRSGVEVERKVLVNEQPQELDRFPSECISQG